MTIKTFTTTLLLAASFLLFAACDSKVKTDTNTTIDGSDENTTIDNGNDDNSTDGSGDGDDDNKSAGGNDDDTATGGGSDDDNATGGGSDDSDTPPTVALTSLTLTIDKTALNSHP